VAFQEGMTITNEPGYYEEATEGKKGFGVRHENVLLVVKKETEHPPFQNRTFLGFERLTHVPFQKKMLDLTLLRPDEVNMCQMMFMRLSLSLLLSLSTGLPLTLPLFMRLLLSLSLSLSMCLSFDFVPCPCPWFCLLEVAINA
jgi:hypothetical protein